MPFIFGVTTLKYFCIILAWFASTSSELFVVQKAQEEIEKHLKTAELLSLKGDTKGEKEKIVNELLKVHTRFQARITEYQLLLNMTIKFFEHLKQVGFLRYESAV